MGTGAGDSSIATVAMGAVAEDWSAIATVAVGAGALDWSKAVGGAGGVPLAEDWSVGKATKVATSATRASTRDMPHQAIAAAKDAATDAPIIELVVMVKEVQRKFEGREAADLQTQRK